MLFPCLLQVMRKLLVSIFFVSHAFYMSYKDYSHRFDFIIYNFITNARLIS